MYITLNVLCCNLMEHVESLIFLFQQSWGGRWWATRRYPRSHGDRQCARSVRERIATVDAELEREKQKCAALQNQLTIERFGITRFTNDNKLISFYIGFATYAMFLSFYECIEHTAKKMQSMYYQASETIGLSARKRCMLLVDELFLFLCRLRFTSARSGCKIQLLFSYS